MITGGWRMLSTAWPMLHKMQTYPGVLTMWNNNRHENITQLYFCQYCQCFLMTMIRHALNVIRVAVKELNPAQVPIVTLDQPLYSFAKQVQWCWPETHGEEHFVIILGGFHIEMCCLKMIGEWLQDSGWVDAIVQAKVASPGTAESLLKASHVILL